jgi:hypothetical protein
MMTHRRQGDLGMIRTMPISMLLTTLVLGCADGEEAQASSATIAGDGAAQRQAANAPDGAGPSSTTNAPSTGAASAGAEAPAAEPSCDVRCAATNANAEHATTWGCTGGDACEIATCEPGFKDCNGDAADGCESATTTCAPIQLAKLAGATPAGVAVDDTDVYVTDATGGRLIQCDKTGCIDHETVIAEPGGALWGNPGGTPLSTRRTCTGNRTQGPLSVARRHVAPTPRRSCCPNQEVSSVGFQWPSTESTSTSRRAAWVFDGARSATAEAPSKTILDNPLRRLGGAVVGVAVNATDVFFAATDHGVFRCSKEDCVGSLQKLGQPPLVWTGLAVDSLSLYFGGNSDGVLRSCPLDGCAQTPSIFLDMKATQGTPNGVATDAKFVYWATQNGLFKIAK